LRPALADWSALDARMGPECLRVATYNLHGCVGADRHRDPARIAQVIAQLGCDTVGLQEVYGLQALASATRMQAIAGPDIVRRGMDLGNGLLTRRPVIAARHHDYSWKTREPRSILDVELDVGGAPLRVLVAHFGLSARERRFQVRRLVELLHATPKEERVVVLGDLNEWLPFVSPLSLLHELLGQTPAVRSFPARWPIFALDRIWARPHHSLLAVEAFRSKAAAVASDHLPLRAMIGYQR
jgi:endonuclease/exonuclease/phosphatase family metal-dependent hydrolase